MTTDKTCGKCREYAKIEEPLSELCGCPMNYHYPAGLEGSPEYWPTTASTKACGYYEEK